MDNVSQFRKKEVSRFVTGKLRAEKMPDKLSGMLVKVRPLFTEWMQADAAFTANTATVAAAVRKTFDTFMAETPNGTRVGFARLFDTTITGDAKTRDLGDNAVYNRLNYLIDKVAGGKASARTERILAEQRRAKVHEDWLKFKKAHPQGKIPMPEVEQLVKSILEDIWNEAIAATLLAA